MESRRERKKELGFYQEVYFAFLKGQVARNYRKSPDLEYRCSVVGPSHITMWQEEV